MAGYKGFIPENIAPLGARRIGVYSEDGNRVGQIPLRGLTPPVPSKKLYSFGALSDVHIGYDTSASDFRAALSYLNEQESVAFTCICGDLTGDGSDTQLSQYKAVVDEYSPNAPIYAITGNHEAYDGRAVTSEKIQPYTGHPLYYSFSHGDDVFIMVGTIGGEMYSDGVVFADGELDWLANTLEANKNKRCFVFQHIFAGVENELYVCGNADGIYTNWCWHNSAECTRFENLMKQYRPIWFHGHSHLRFSLQSMADYANYSNADGYHSVHVPSITVPRDDANNAGVAENVYAGSEGYVVDVYSDGIHLRGRDFVKGEFLPIASYWLDT
jgi:predicted phosphodiesterase